MSSPQGKEEATPTQTTTIKTEVNYSSDTSGEASENINLKSEDITAPGDQEEVDSPVENQVIN